MALSVSTFDREIFPSKKGQSIKAGVTIQKFKENVSLSPCKTSDKKEELRQGEAVRG